MRIEKATLDFLKRLAKNNDRDWFKANRPAYDQAKENVASCADLIIQGLNKTDEISTISGKKSLYRIHRDVRFSHDKTPYNLWFSGYFRRATAARRGGYYFNIQANNQSLIGGGFWGPSKEDLLLLRQQIVLDDEPLRSVIESQDFSENFQSLKGERLKTTPKGFAKDDPAIDLLRYKQFLVSRPISDNLLLSDEYIPYVIASYEAMRPFFDVMSMYLITDLNGDSTL